MNRRNKTTVDNDYRPTTMRTSRRIKLFCLVALPIFSASAFGCFDPNLGDIPYRCAPTGKSCPDGFECRTVSGESLCVRDGLDATIDQASVDLLPSKEGGVFLDGSVVQSSTGCLDQQDEPNNTSSTATSLGGQTDLIPGWEVCYGGDVDHYSKQVEKGEKLVVKVIFDHDKGDLDAALLDPAGNVVRTSRTETDDEDLSITVVDPGTYIIGVYGFGSVHNTYDLRIDIL
jgi:hypothetical protein